jgi:hypothetical protein
MAFVSIAFAAPVIWQHATLTGAPDPFVAQTDDPARASADERNGQVNS